MKLNFSKQQKLILLTAALILLAFATVIQLIFLQPAKAELKTKRNTLLTEQKMAAVIAQKNSQSKQNLRENTNQLQLELPVKPLQEQFILDLQKIETLSDSEIKSMTFSTDDQRASQTAQENQVNSKVQPSINSAKSGSQQQDQASGNQRTISAQPAGLQKLTVQLRVESPSYEDFEKFVKNLESLKRLTVVETIQYTGNSEITVAGKGNDPFVYSLTVSTFYMNNLDNLEADLPKIDTPAPAGKSNPLTRFPEMVDPGKSE